MTRTLTFSIASAALLLSGVAYAQTSAQTTVQPAAQTERPARTARPDMTREAVQERATQMFARLDVNSDGKIDAADRAERSGERTAARFERADTNGDGTISTEEFAAARDMTRNRMGNRMAARNESAGGEQRGGGMGQSRGLLGQADGDGDSAVTQAEFSAAMIARFDAADANNDGTVSSEERRAARPEARGGQRGEGRRDRMRRQRETNG
jgi:Ca2+-binding EF-hand superfamily protein